MSESTWGTRLRELRRAAGLSQRTLAAAVGIDHTYLSKIESSAYGPPAGETIRRIAVVLGIDPNATVRAAGKALPGYVERLEVELRAGYAMLAPQLHPEAIAVPGPLCSWLVRVRALLNLPADAPLPPDDPFAVPVSGAQGPVI